MPLNLNTSLNRERVFRHRDVVLPYQDLKVETKDGRRFYTTPEGIRYPSITTVLSSLGKDLLLEWKNRVGEKEANRVSHHASKRGNSVHDLLEKYVKNEENIFDGFVSPMVRKNVLDLSKVLNRHLDNVHIQEKPLYSHHLGVAGRVDLIGEWDGVLSVIDFKTSSRIKRHEWIHPYFMQESFYAVAYEEITSRPVPQLVTIIAVDYNEPQVFIEKRDTWVPPLIEVIRDFRKISLDFETSMR
jgi:genome maintenance exonuclease 1